MTDELFPAPCQIKEISDARTQADDQGRQEGRDEAGHGRDEAGNAALGIIGRAEGQEPQAGSGDRDERVRAAVAQAQKIGRQFRIFLHDKTTYDLTLSMTFLDFIQHMVVCHGILLDKAWIPEHMVKLIVEIDTSGEATPPHFSGNVVSLRRGP